MIWTELAGHWLSSEAHHLHAVAVPTTGVPTTRVSGDL